MKKLLAIVLLLSGTLLRGAVTGMTLLSFLLGALMLIIGSAFFTLGADVSMMPMGQYVGSKMTKTKKLWLILLVSLFVGVMITISEPDLQVLADQVPAIPNQIIIPKHLKKFTHIFFQNFS